VTYAVGGPREKTTLTLFVILAFLALSKQRWGLAGACVAMATLTWQPSFITGLFAAAVTMAGLGRREMWPAAIRFCVGGLIPTALITAGFALAGALSEFLEGFVLINQRYTRQGGFLAWALWLLIHIAFLIGYANRIVVITRWGWSFFTHGRGSRLITGDPLLPPIEEPEPPA